MWKELRELNEIFTPVKKREVIDDSDVIRVTRMRKMKEYFNQLIQKYLRENNKSISEITKKDVNLLGKDYTIQDREILIQQIIYRLETNYGKPLKWIKDNDKSALFREIDKHGSINTRTEENDNWTWD